MEGICKAKLPFGSVKHSVYVEQCGLPENLLQCFLIGLAIGSSSRTWVEITAGLGLFFLGLGAMSLFLVSEWLNQNCNVLRRAFGCN